MVGVYLDLLLLMHGMNAVGLIPDDEYNLQRQRMVDEVTKIKWIGNPDGYDDRDNGPFSENEFDWRIVIDDFLRHLNDLSEVANIDIKLDLWVAITERFRLNVFRPERAPLSVSSLVLKEAAEQRAAQAAMRAEIGKLQNQMDSMKAELGRMRTQNANADMRSSSPNVRKSSANRDEIRSLQEQMARCLQFATIHEAKGESIAAGNLRGEAARLESKLRALGA